MPGSRGPPAAEPLALAASMCQEQAVAASASSTQHHRLWKKLTETHPSVGQTCCYANGKPGLPLGGKRPRQEQKSGEYPRPPTDRPTRQGHEGGWHSARCQVGRVLVRDIVCADGGVKLMLLHSPPPRVSLNIQEFLAVTATHPCPREPAVSPKRPAVSTPTGKDGKLQLPVLLPFMRIPKG